MAKPVDDNIRVDTDVTSVDFIGHKDGIGASAYARARYYSVCVWENHDTIAASIPIPNAAVYLYTDEVNYRLIGYTNGEGKLTYIWTKSIDETEPPEICYFNIVAEGYESAEKVEVEMSMDSDDYTNVFLDPMGGNYYGVYVETVTHTPIVRAAISFYTSKNSSTPFDTGTTDENGKCIYHISENAPEHIFISVSKNGYNSVSGVDIGYNKSFNGANTNPTVVQLTQGSETDHYYVLYVKDTNLQPVEGVSFRLYRDFAWTQPVDGGEVYLSDANGYDDLLYVVNAVIANVLSISISSLHKEDVFSTHLSVNSSRALSIINGVNNRLECNLSPSDLNINDTIDTFVQNIRTQYPTIKLVQSTYTSDEYGVISLPAEDVNMTSVRPLYPQLICLPQGRTTVTNNGTLTATLEETVPGLVWSVSSKSGEVKCYHNFRVIDAVSEEPISGAKVTYKDRNTVIDERNTDSNGFIGIEYKGVVSVDIQKAGYRLFSTTSEGKTDINDIVEVKIVPESSIQVLIQTEDKQEPAEKIDVEIRYYEQQSSEQYVSIKKYKTNKNGYINTLDNTTMYSSGKYRAVVVNYKIASHLQYSLSIWIKVGENKILLPPEITDADMQNDFSKFNEISINGIKTQLDKGDKVSYDGEKSSVSDYNIRIVDPDSINVYDIFACTPVIVDNNNKSVIGSVDIGLKNDVNELRLKVINRYSGYYNPIFKDVLFYKNFEADEDSEKTCPYSNTSFDYEYSDRQGKFGVINNMWFHKVNDNKDIEIINTLTPYYPLIGQYALDHKDYNMFSSSWDMNYYTRQVNVENSESCPNISSMKEGLCMFGSKYLNVPELINIYGFDMGDDESWTGEWNDDWITNTKGCPGEMMYKEVNNNSVDFYFFFKKRIVRYFQEILIDEFSKYIDPSKYSFGKEGLEDDIEEYVIKNILKLYKLEKVKMYVRRTKKGVHNSKIENDYTAYLDKDVDYFKSHGFVEVNTMTMSKINRDDFDRKIVYNLRNGSQEDFGFSITLKKI